MGFGRPDGSEIGVECPCFYVLSSTRSFLELGDGLMARSPARMAARRPVGLPQALALPLREIRQADLLYRERKAARSWIRAWADSGYRDGRSRASSTSARRRRESSTGLDHVTADASIGFVRGA